MELREETGVQRSLTERLVRSRLQWAGHRRKDGGWTDFRRQRKSYVRRAGEKRGSPRMRWEDCVKRDARKLGEEEDWKKKTRYMGGWKRLSDETVKSCGHHLTHDKGNKRKREERERERV